MRTLRPGDEGSQRWTFTRERWQDRSKLSVADRTVIVEDVWAAVKGRGYFRDLLNAIEADGFEALVQTPLNEMQAILKHYGFQERLYWRTETDPVSRWQRVRTAGTTGVGGERA